MKIRKELWFGLIFMALIISAAGFMLLSVDRITDGHLGMLMLSMVVVAIMLGFPTAFTLMGMGMIFTWLAYERDVTRTLDLMVQAAYKTMASDVLIAIPLFVFMGYLVERANLIERLFKSLHLAMARVPGSLAVATLVTCAVFATATGIVGAVVTLMGLLALPPMLRAGYNTSMAAGAITAGGCLGILIPPSVLLIVYGATAGVSVVQLYAGAFFPGVMLAGLYVLYVIILAKLKPSLAPPLSMEDRRVDLPARTLEIPATNNESAFPRLIAAVKGRRNQNVPFAYVLRQLVIVVVPALLFVLLIGSTYNAATTVRAQEVYDISPLGGYNSSTSESSGGLAEPPGAESESSASSLQEPPGSEGAAAPAASAPDAASPAAAAAAEGDTTRPAPTWWWVVAAVATALIAAFYLYLTFARLEIFKMLLTSFFPLAMMILAVLGSIVFGLTTPTEAAAVGALGGVLLAAAYGRLNLGVVRESAFLTAKTSAMVCWLFVGSAIFSAAFALLGGQALVEQWVLGLDLTKTQFLVLSQVIIFILGWPLEWTEIIVIFMPIFLPLLTHFDVDPLFFGLLVALNLQTAFLSPPVAMSAFYLKGVAPSHVTLNQIFAGMMPFMGIQVLAIILLYQFPAIGMWLPELLYK